VSVDSADRSCRVYFAAEHIAHVETFSSGDGTY